MIATDDNTSASYLLAGEPRRLASTNALARSVQECDVDVHSAKAHSAGGSERDMSAWY